tara:strand:+ start:83 stop:259 length:177 start_codon:yes stop_codon:yes gene_type:complete
MSDSMFDKPGNATWAQCPACDYWFPVAPVLLQMETVDLICPDCSEPFAPKDAKALVGG